MTNKLNLYKYIYAEICPLWQSYQCFFQLGNFKMRGLQPQNSPASIPFIGKLPSLKKSTVPAGVIGLMGFPPWRSGKTPILKEGTEADCLGFHDQIFPWGNPSLENKAQYSEPCSDWKPLWGNLVWRPFKKKIKPVWELVL